MPISQEELSSRPLSTRLVPFFDEKNPNTFAMALQFPNGGRAPLWAFDGPDFPITEPWLREAHAQLMQRITDDLKNGNPYTRPPMAPDMQAFRDTNWMSMTGAVRKALEQWVHRRAAWARDNCKPIILLP